MVRWVLLFVLSVSVASCTSMSGYGTTAVKAEAIVSAIEPGVSTKDDVKSLLGEPSEMLPAEGGGESWHYVYVELESTSYLVVQSGHSRVLSLAVVFDEGGIVREVRRGRSGGAGEEASDPE